MSFYPYEDFLRRVGSSEAHLARACRHSDVFFAYVAGSAVENHATANSDLDVYVVTTLSRASLAGRLRSGIVAALGQLPVDLTVIDRAAVARVVRSAGDSRRSSTTPSPDAVSFLHRLFRSRPLAGHAAYVKVRSSFDHGGFCRRVAAALVADVDKLVRDVEAMVDLGEQPSASMTAADALRLAGQALLFANGISLDRPKWLLWNLARLPADQALASEVAATLSAGPCDKDGPGSLRAAVLAAKVADRCRSRLIDPQLRRDGHGNGQVSTSA